MFDIERFFTDSVQELRGITVDEYGQVINDANDVSNEIQPADENNPNVENCQKNKIIAYSRIPGNCLGNLQSVSFPMKRVCDAINQVEYNQPQEARVESQEVSKKSKLNDVEANEHPYEASFLNGELFN